MNYITAFILELIFLSKSMGHIFKVLSTLTIIGFASRSNIASIVAIKLKACVITLSPFLTPKAFKPIL